MHRGTRLTSFFPLPKRYFGYTAMDWFKFYGFIAVAWFVLAYVYTNYLNLFNDIANKPASTQFNVALFTGSALLLVLPAALGFLWWASGALVRYSRWQLRQPLFWRIFWMVSLLFLVTVFIDPLDAIHAQMSRKGMWPVPNLLLIFEGREWWAKVQARQWSELLFQFQLGYFLLWFMFWFLVVIAHWQYMLDGLREAWFYMNRFHRYGGSVLTGFRETARTMATEPATVDYPRQSVPLPASYRGVPRLAVDELTKEQAAAIVAADESRAIVTAPGQPTVLFIDLGKYEYSPALSGLRTADGQPLLEFGGEQPRPAVSREEMVIPLARPGGPPHIEPLAPGADDQAEGGDAR